MDLRKLEDNMSEFQSDIKDKEYDEDGNELDKHGFKVKKYPNGLESVRKSVENCEQMCGLDKNAMFSYVYHSPCNLTFSAP